MELANTIDLSQLEDLTNLAPVGTKLNDLVQTNLDLIKQLNSITFVLPITKQIILLLYLGYHYKIPMIKGAALYQLYANDLIVIALSLLENKINIDEISTKCEVVYNKLKGDFDAKPDGEYNDLYSKLIHCVFEGKLYVPPSLW